MFDSKVWTEKVRPIAMECIVDQKAIDIINLIREGHDTEITEEDGKYLEEASKKYEDFYGMYNISEMIKIVDNNLSENPKEQKGIFIYFALQTVYSKYTDEFMKETFEDMNSSEAQSRIKLKKAIHEYLGIR